VISRSVLAFLVILAACGYESRTESRQRRLDTFRSALPDSIKVAFDNIETEEDCNPVAEMITLARDTDPDFQAQLDSIMHAELIDTFSDRDLVYFFWYYFAYALETGSVPEP
jgi:hypothetical protein